MPGEYELSDLSGVLGGDLYNNLFSTQGFEGFGDGFGGYAEKENPWMQQWGWNEGSGPNWSTVPTQEAMGVFDNYSFNWNPSGGQGGTLTAFDPSGQQSGTFEQKDEDTFTKLMGMVAPAVASMGFGGALSGMFGGGITGGALGQGLASGSMSAMQGGNFGKGFLSGAVSGGMGALPKAGMSPASFAGIDNPTFAGMFNRGVGSTVGSLAAGNSGSDALKSGLTGAALSGINSVGKNVMSDYFSSVQDWIGGGQSASMSNELDALGGNMVSDPMDQSVDPMMYSDEGARFDNSADFSYGFQPTSFLSGATPDQTAQSVGTDSPLASLFGDVGGRVGNFALNNAGDLASMLYGFYNNRRQQKAIKQQIGGLQSLYGQNSPYAQQLRAKLNAQAAASGRRSNVAGRETQLQAMLADRNAQMAPNLMALNQARGQLQNSLGSNALSMLNKMGAFQGLGNMFRPPMGNYSMVNNTNDYNLLGSLEGMR